MTASLKPVTVRAVELHRYTDNWSDDDPDANFKGEVAAFTVQDPLPTFQQLSANTGIPVGALVRYVLVKWASEGHELIMHAGPRMIRRMQGVCDEAEAAGDTQARLAAYETLRQMIGWLQVPLDAE
ncbi:MAG: DUF6027 family protein [Euzebya sp.]